MADLNIFGTEFADVSGFKIPDINGDIVLYTENDGSGTAVDISDTTATAPDVAEGKYFYTREGIKTLGTGSGGGVDGDNLAYGQTGSAIVGSAIVGIAVVGEDSGAVVVSAAVGIAVAGQIE